MPRKQSARTEKPLSKTAISNEWKGTKVIRQGIGGPDSNWIPTSRFETTEFDDLDDYLDDDFNHEVHLARTKFDDNETNFSELEFFKTFYRLLTIVKANLAKPLAVERALEPYGIDYTRTLITYADRLEYPGLRESRALAHLREKVRKSDEEVKRLAGRVVYYTQDQLQELEFTRRKKEAELEAEIGFNATRNEPDAAKSKIKRHPDLTIDRAILLIDAIGGSRLKSADREKLAEVVAYLTGDSAESVRQRYSALNPENEGYKGYTEKGMKTLRRDMEILSYYFDLIGLRGELKELSEKLSIPLTK